MDYPALKKHRLMLGCLKGKKKKKKRYNRKMTKDCAIKTSEAGITLYSFARGKLQKMGVYSGLSKYAGDRRYRPLL